MLTYFCFLLFLSTSLCDSFQNQLLNQLEEALENVEANSTCVAQYQKFIHGIKKQQLWALKMVDSDGAIPIGIFDGNLVDLGAFDECLSIEHHTNNSTVITGKYCLGTLNMNVTSNFNPLVLEVINQFNKLNKTKQIMTAACIPSDCNAADVRDLYKVFDFGIDFNDKLCQTKGQYSNFGLVGVFAIFVLVSLVSVVFLATVMELIAQEQPFKYLEHFSLVQNGRTFLTLNQSSHHLPCIQGIRILSALWLILNHKYMVDYVMLPRKNGNYTLESLSYVVVIAASFSCDTFFLIGGLLVTYNYMRGKGEGLQFYFCKYYWLRYLRLTPALAITILIYVGIFDHLGSGPLWPSLLHTYFVDSCKDNWWKALLYIQEFQPLTSICVFQTWYLSVDMQFFIFSPILLVVLAEKPKFAIVAFGIISLCSMLLAFITGWMLQLNWNYNSLNMDHYYTGYYFAPQIRIGPWMIGLILGYVISTKPEELYVFTKKTIRTLWCCSLLLILVCLLCGYNLYMGDAKELENAFNMAILRPLWTIGVGWIIYACLTGQGGNLNLFLSLPIFQILAKLTYCMFLSQFIVLFVQSGQIKTVGYFSNYQEFTTYWVDLLWILAVSLILHLFVEMPFRNFNRLTVSPQDKNEVDETSPLILL